MNRSICIVLAVGVTAGAFALGCSESIAQNNDTLGDGVALEDDSLEPQDNGTSYGGWTMAPSGTYTWSGASIFTTFSINYARTSGPTARGGGACMLYKKTGSSCTDGAAGDAVCTTGAKAQFGNDAWGYCYQGACYHRPGAQPNLCTVSPSRSPGLYTGTFYGVPAPSGYVTIPYVLGCMTKGAAVATGCGCEPGGTYLEANVQKSCPSDYTTVYMRSVVQSTWFDPCSQGCGF